MITIDSKFKTARTLADVKADPRVVEVWTEDDGFNANGRPAYWARLADGYKFDGETTCLHEGTVRDLCRALNLRVEFVGQPEPVVEPGTMIELRDAAVGDWIELGPVLESWTSHVGLTCVRVRAQDGGTWSVALDDDHRIQPPIAHAPTELPTLTDNQRKLISAILHSEYRFDPNPIGEHVWSFDACDGFDPKSAGGIVARAVDAGLIEADGTGNDATVAVTQLGFDAYHADQARQADEAVAETLRNAAERALDSLAAALSRPEVGEIVADLCEPVTLAEQIVDAVAEYADGVTTSQIAKLVDVSRSLVKREIAELAGLGLLVSSGKTRNVRWHLG